MSSSGSGRSFRLPGSKARAARLPGRGVGLALRGARGTGIAVSALLVATLLPTQAWALPPTDPRDAVELETLQDTEQAPPDETKIDQLTSWSGAADEPPAEYIPKDVAPPAQGAGTVALDDAGTQLVQVGDLPVSLGKATPTASEPAPPAPEGSWAVTVESRDATEAAEVDGAIIKVTPPLSSSTPVDVELDYSKFEDLYGTEWSSRLRLLQFPECFLTTPELPECTTAVHIPSTNDPSAETVRATIDPAASQVQGLTAQSGGAPVVLAATDSASGTGGTYRATSLSPSGSWSAGGSSGGFSWTYPLTVPAPPAGPAPSIAFGYSSQSVDGKTSVANSQASWIGDGWDYHPGFVERRYRSCADDLEEAPNNDTDTDRKKSDLCWASDNLVLSLGGSTTELVRNDADGKWIAANDDGAKVEYLTKANQTKGKQTGRYDGEYWRVTTRDGTRYHFGRNDLDGAGARPQTNSAFTTPVYGNHTGEPCHATAYASSACEQAWRWNLDYVEDVHGNAMVIDWKKETNEYAQNEQFEAPVTYTRGGYPTQILYGLRADNLTGAAAGKVTFAVGERCVKEGSVTCSLAEFESENYEDKQPWWDTPATLHCKTTAKNCYISAPTFWTRVMLTSVSTYGQRTPGSTALSRVDTWSLKQSFPKQRTDTHPPLWLESITRTGYGTTKSAAGEQDSTALPSVSFIANVVDMPNRVATSSEDATPDFDRLRVETIRTETGGEIYVDYSAPCPVGTAHPAPAENTSRCFPSKWSPDPDLENPRVEWFNKYVVENVIEKDRVARQPDVLTTYLYDSAKGAAWAKNTDEFTKPELRTYDQWRGYEKVAVRRGATSSSGTATATQQSETVTRYFRGMSRDAGRTLITVKDSDNGQTLGEDLLAYQGRTAETITMSGVGGSVISRELTWPYADKTATRIRGNGLPPLEAYRTGTIRAEAAQSISGGKTRSTHFETLTRDSYGLPLTTHAYTLTPNAAGGTDRTNQSCTTTTYLHNDSYKGYVPNSPVGFYSPSDPYLVGLPQRTRTTVGSCTEASTAAGDQVISDTRTSYDALGAFGTPPQKGLPRQVDTINGDGSGWITTTRTDYDALGRATKVLDAKGNPTTTTYSPTAGVAFQATTTNALGHSATSAYDPGRSTLLSATDANGRKTQSRYDDLGRLTDVWSPTRNPATDAASAHFDYQIAADKVPAVTTRTLRDNGTYEDSVTIYDGLLRPRQTQSEALGGGRIVTDSLYNANGTVSEAKNGYFAKSEPKPEIFVPDTVFEVPNSTKVAYDGLGRVIRTTTLYNDTAQHSTTAQYAGDWTLTRTGMNADGTAPLEGSRAVKTSTDALGRVEQVQHYTTLVGPAPATINTLYTYNPRGSLATVTDHDGNAWTYTYDVRGRLKASADPDMGPSSFGYNDLDQQVWSKDGRERAQYTLYDALGRQTELRDDSETGPLVAKWTYDDLPGARGYPVASTRYNDGAAYTSEITGYDTEYRPTGSKITIPPTGATTGLAGTYAYSNTYTATGKPQSVTLPATPGGLVAEKVITRYNGEGAPITTSGLQWYTSGTLYSPQGEVLRTTSGENSKRLWTTTAYDEFTGRVKQTVAQRETTSPIWSSRLAYGYDTVGNITSITGTHSESTDAATVTKKDQQCFAYDPMGRLIDAWTGLSDCPTAADGRPDRTQLSPGVEGSGYWQSYTFDAIGNRTSMTVHDFTDEALDDVRTYTHGRTDTNNGTQATTTAQPHTLTRTDSKVVTPTSTVESRSTYSYDASGNTDRRIINGDTQSLQWDRRNKVTSVDTDNNGTPDVTYLYDASGNRLIEDNGTTRTLYLGDTEITVNTAGQALDAQRYYTHPGAPTTTRTTGGKNTGHKLTVLLADHHNTSTTAVEQTNSQAVSQRYFDPYGNPRGSKPTAWPGRRTFLGTGIDDPETGLTHIGAREYDASTGRFLSADPIIDITDPLQMNGYTYANANPVTYTDPTGLKLDDGSGGKGETYYKDYDWGSCPVGSSCSEATQQTATEAFLNTVEQYNSGAPAVRNSSNTSEEEFDRAVRMYRSESAGPEEEAAWQMWRYGASEEDIEYFLQYSCDFLKCNYGKPVDAAMSGELIESPFTDRKYQHAFTASMLAGAGYKGVAAGVGSKVSSRLQGCFSNSFTAGTEVLLADGSTKQIEEVQVGDRVFATDPETGEAKAKIVTAEISGTGSKDLVKITIDTDGGGGHETATVTATEGHPFWVPALADWIDATNLRAGQWLLTRSEQGVQVAEVERWTQTQTVYNLTVADLHTYYVLAGKTTVLVHNANAKQCITGYENPGHHDPHGGPNAYNPKKGVLPADAEAQFQNSVLVSGVRWTKIGTGKKAVYYRYSDNGHGQWHWSGGSNGRDNRGNPVEIPMEHVPIQVRRG
ncbi:polymorphic toxin-type HINT domain-containing protein [Streptomyces sp. NPDC054861]